MAVNALPSPKLLRKLLRYEPDSGLLFWRERSPELFPTKRAHAMWNTRFVGKRAFITDCHGYCQGAVFGRAYMAHRVIWAMETNAWPRAEIDHINNVRTDNRWVNLRQATRQQNGRNRPSHRNASSKYLGVSWYKPTKKWRSTIVVGRIQSHLGYFESENDAALAYDHAAERLFGEFANLNFRDGGQPPPG